jgi:hypothetical protein
MLCRLCVEGSARHRGIAGDGFHLHQPDDRIDKATYLERCWPNGERIVAHHIERIFDQGNAAFATYKCLTREGTEFRNTEFFTFEGERIKTVDVYFGAAYRDGVFSKA